MGGKRQDSRETVDTAIDLLRRLQADGYVLEGFEYEPDWGKPHKGAARVLLGATVKVKLISAI